ncbi:hypothetical protein CBR_g2946 [Chara braunii]|uniref:Protein kinase domain-containing protein n=1 Tax=Chara braunii TaxID=69332 RepID=A0A388KED9_CHABU|nr:hypothetical protein CBR_g2946 [Chara braunii]|eukprot:GBG68401.1 hypothetical protein CBR_g2946 [Chara braunii]
MGGIRRIVVFSRSSQQRWGESWRCYEKGKVGLPCALDMWNFSTDLRAKPSAKSTAQLNSMSFRETRGEQTSNRMRTSRRVAMKMQCTTRTRAGTTERARRLASMLAMAMMIRSAATLTGTKPVKAGHSSRRSALAAAELRNGSLPSPHLSLSPPLPPPFPSPPPPSDVPAGGEVGPARSPTFLRPEVMSLAGQASIVDWDPGCQIVDLDLTEDGESLFFTVNKRSSASQRSYVRIAPISSLTPTGSYDSGGGQDNLDKSSVESSSSAAPVASSSSLSSQSSLSISLRSDYTLPVPWSSIAGNPNNLSSVGSIAFFARGTGMFVSDAVWPGLVRTATLDESRSVPFDNVMALFPLSLKFDPTASILYIGTTNGVLKTSTDTEGNAEAVGRVDTLSGPDPWPSLSYGHTSDIDMKGYRESESDPRSARFNCPMFFQNSLSADGQLLYVADRENHCIRVVNTSSGGTRLLAGSPLHPGSGDGIPSTALFSRPFGVALTPTGCGLFITEQADGGRLRLITFDRPNGTPTRVETILITQQDSSSMGGSPVGSPSGGYTALTMSSNGEWLYMGSDYGKIYRLAVNASSSAFGCDTNPSTSSSPTTANAAQGGTDRTPRAAAGGDGEQGKRAAIAEGQESNAASMASSDSNANLEGTVNNSTGHRTGKRKPKLSKTAAQALGLVLGLVGVLALSGLVYASLYCLQFPSKCHMRGIRKCLVPIRSIPTLHRRLIRSRSSFSSTIEFTNTIDVERPLAAQGSGSRRASGRGSGSGGAGSGSSAVESTGGSPGQATRFSFASLAAACDNFSPINVIGRGAAGEVYRGLLGDGKAVAVKIVKGAISGSKLRQFHAEINVLSALNHSNLRNIIGYCTERNRWILVYPYVGGGSLYDRLHRYSEERMDAEKCANFKDDSESMDGEEEIEIEKLGHLGVPLAGEEDGQGLGAGGGRAAGRGGKGGGFAGRRGGKGGGKAGIHGDFGGRVGVGELGGGGGPEVEEGGGPYANGHSQVSLDWEMRLQIAVQMASVMRYLHHDVDPPVLHRDVKSSNVLVETCGGGRKVRAYLSDFGLARLGQSAFDLEAGDGACRSTVDTRHVCGTFGYMAPEYVITGRLTTKNDVYAFGVVLLELVSGKRAFFELTAAEQKAEEEEEEEEEEQGEGGGEEDKESEKPRPTGKEYPSLIPMLIEEDPDHGGGGGRTLVSWVMDQVRRRGKHSLSPKVMDIIVDNKLKKECTSWNSIYGVMRVALDCVHRDAKQRPRMDHVHQRLSRILEDTNKWNSFAKSRSNRSDVVKAAVKPV